MVTLVLCKCAFVYVLPGRMCWTCQVERDNVVLDREDAEAEAAAEERAAKRRVPEAFGAIRMSGEWRTIQ
jgi:hypothetical protein